MSESYALDVNHLTIKYNKEHGPLEGIIDFSVKLEKKGEWLGVLGPSGSGKSTILKSIAGVEDRYTGTIRIDGEDCSKMPTGRRKAVLVWQEESLFESMSVMENARFACKTDDEAQAALKLFQVDENLWFKPPRKLSGGQKQRVVLARAYAAKPRIILLDEPFKGLDLESRRQIVSAFQQMKKANQTAVLVSHDVDEVLAMCDYIIVLDQGKKVSGSPTSKLLDEPANQKTAELVAPNNIWPANINNGIMNITGANQAVIGSAPVKNKECVPGQGWAIVHARKIRLGDPVPNAIVIKQLKHERTEVRSAGKLEFFSSPLLTQIQSFDPNGKGTSADSCWFLPDDVWVVNK